MAGDLLVKYDLSHLTQDTRRVFGPIQDDEALLLYAFIRCASVKVVIEVGGQTGYSARNFMAAGAEVYTIDIDPVATISPRHHVIHANVGSVDASMFQRCDLLFFDAHAEEEQFGFYGRLKDAGVIGAWTTIALHDTGLHKHRFVEGSTPVGDKWEHQAAERRIAARLTACGWAGICVHADDDDEPRHGLTLLQLRKDAQ